MNHRVWLAVLAISMAVAVRSQTLKDEIPLKTKPESPIIRKGEESLPPGTIARPRGPKKKQLGQAVDFQIVQDVVSRTAARFSRSSPGAAPKDTCCVQVSDESCRYYCCGERSNMCQDECAILSCAGK